MSGLLSVPQTHNFINRCLVWLSLLFFALFLAACSGSVVATDTSIPSSATPTATVDPVSLTATPAPTPTFVSGFGDIPPGKYLFVEYWNDTSAEETVAGKCGLMAIDFPTYEFNPQTRNLKGTFNWGQEKPLNSVKGFFGRGQSLQEKVGFGIRSYLEPIIALPLQSIPFTINGVNANGTIVIEIAGHIETLEPNQSWTKTESSESTPGCQRTNTERFTNYGLLEKNQIDLK